MQRETDDELFLDDNNTSEEDVENEREQRLRYSVRERHAVRSMGKQFLIPKGMHCTRRQTYFF